MKFNSIRDVRSSAIKNNEKIAWSRCPQIYVNQSISIVSSECCDIKYLFYMHEKMHKWCGNYKVYHHCSGS